MRFTSIAVVVIASLSTTTCIANVAVEESGASVTTTKPIVSSLSLSSQLLRGNKSKLNQHVQNKNKSRQLKISDDIKTLLLGPPTCTQQYPSKIDLSLGFFGNSILFFNDSPRIIQQMMIDNSLNVIQQTCVKGGASFLTLYDLGCSMGKTWLPNNIIKVDKGKCTEINRPRTVQDTLTTNNFDYIILNDQTQYPARSTTVDESKYVLQNLFGPIWPNSSKDNKKKAIPIIVLTPAYRYPVMQYTMDLGDFNQFTDLLIDGVTQYQKVFIDKLDIPDARIAPVGEGYRYIKERNEELFAKLYNKDNYHPSIYGTYLQSLIIYMTILNKDSDPLPPTTFQKEWFDNVRGINHEDYPSIDEAKELYNAAVAVMKRSGSTTTTGSTDASNLTDDTDTSAPDSSDADDTDTNSSTGTDDDDDDAATLSSDADGDDTTDIKDDDKSDNKDDDKTDNDSTDTTTVDDKDTDDDDDDDDDDDNDDDDTKDNGSNKGKEKETKSAKRVNNNTNTSSSSASSTSSSASDVPSITPSKDDTDADAAAAAASDVPSSKPSTVVDQENDKEEGKNKDENTAKDNDDKNNDDKDNATTTKKMDDKNTNNDVDDNKNTRANFNKNNNKKQQMASNDNGNDKEHNKTTSNNNNKDMNTGSNK